MKMLATAALALTFAFGGSVAVAKDSPTKQPNGKERLLRGLDAIASQDGNPPGQSKRPHDPDQGDDNASPRAIFVVCNMATPAAERSAICDRGPVSPY